MQMVMASLMQRITVLAHITLIKRTRMKMKWAMPVIIAGMFLIQIRKILLE
jgi:hypothetical protein